MDALVVPQINTVATKDQHTYESLLKLIQYVNQMNAEIIALKAQVAALESGA